jgi:hypothetical protein
MPPQSSGGHAITGYARRFLPVGRINGHEFDGVVPIVAKIIDIGAGNGDLAPRPSAWEATGSAVQAFSGIGRRYGCVLERIGPESNDSQPLRAATKRFVTWLLPGDLVRGRPFPFIS